MYFEHYFWRSPQVTAINTVHYICAVTPMYSPQVSCDIVKPCTAPSRRTILTEGDLTGAGVGRVRPSLCGEAKRGQRP